MAGCLAPILLLLRPFTFTVRDVLIAAASGVGMGIGLGLLYRGYARVSVGVVAPVSSVLLALVPVLYDVVRGGGISGLALGGMGLGLAAVALVTYRPGGVGSRSAGFLLGALAGLAFGVAFTLMDVISDAAGLSPVVTQRFAGFAVLAVSRLVDPSPLLVRHAPRGAAVATGVFAVGAMTSLQLAFRYGSAGSVSVATSQYATIAVLMAVVVNGERLRSWQIVGIAAAAIGVAFIALG